MKKISVLAAAVLLAVSGLCAADDYKFSAVAFGQSTDMNFKTNVLPEKVGMNNVYLPDGTVLGADPLPANVPFSVESRGGKIGNSHDGLTFYYTKLPADKNFVLTATVTIDQFGPENGANPAAQEGAGLLVRDTLGKARESEVIPGYEEFPASSNMSMAAVMTLNKKNAHNVKVVHVSRNGVLHPWGNTGIQMLRDTVNDKIDLEKTNTFKLKLERTDDGIIASYAPANSDAWESHKVGGADRLTVLDRDSYYVGFFASRNARMTVKDYSLTESQANTKAEPFTPKAMPVVVQVTSSDVSPKEDYVFSLRVNYDGRLDLSLNGAAAGSVELKAGEFAQLPVKLSDGVNKLEYAYAPAGQEGVKGNLDVTLDKSYDAMTLFAAPEGTAEGKGTSDSPLDFATAVKKVAPGGTVLLLDGEYLESVIEPGSSGLKGLLKTIKPADGAAPVLYGLDLNASFVKAEGLDVTAKPFNIAGSYNVIERVTAHHCDDTGIWVATPGEWTRPLWASYNEVLNCTSYDNMDEGHINADGFAVKMRVGEGNHLKNCLSYGNVDDGYDLFNKIEDGPNGAVLIENSVAYGNQNNGFKLGGEGQPVAHKLHDSVAAYNGMDGVTDNFNPGAIEIKNVYSVDNTRFNFIFRKGPYTDVKDQGKFENAVSIRTAEGQYPDVVNGNIGSGNQFLENTAPTDNSAYKSVKLQDVPERNADGSFNFGDFLQK